MDDALGQPHRANLQARKLELGAGLGADELAARPPARMNSVEPPPMSMISSRCDGSRRKPRTHCQVGEPCLGLARNDLEFEPVRSRTRRIKFSPSVASRSVAVPAVRIFSAPAARACSTNSAIVSSVRSAATGSRRWFWSTPCPSRVTRARFDHAARAAVGRGLGHEHQDRVGADVERANLHGVPCGNDGVAADSARRALRRSTRRSRQARAAPSRFSSACRARASQDPASGRSWRSSAENRAGLDR